MYPCTCLFYRPSLVWQQTMNKWQNSWKHIAMKTGQAFLVSLWAYDVTFLCFPIGTSLMLNWLYWLLRKVLRLLQEQYLGIANRPTAESGWVAWWPQEAKPDCLVTTTCMLCTYCHSLFVGTMFALVLQLISIHLSILLAQFYLVCWIMQCLVLSSGSCILCMHAWVVLACLIPLLLLPSSILFLVLLIYQTYSLGDCLDVQSHLCSGL